MLACTPFARVNFALLHARVHAGASSVLLELDNFSEHGQQLANSRLARRAQGLELSAHVESWNGLVAMVLLGRVPQFGS